MCGLKQAALLAYNFFKHNLAPHFYAPIPYTSGLWKHTTRRIVFCLCIDEYGIKYYNKDDDLHFNHNIATILQSLH